MLVFIYYYYFLKKGGLTTCIRIRKRDTPTNRPSGQTKLQTEIRSPLEVETKQMVETNGQHPLPETTGQGQNPQLTAPTPALGPFHWEHLHRWGQHAAQGTPCYGAE